VEPIAALTNKETMRRLLFKVCDVRCRRPDVFLFNCSSSCSSFSAVLIDSSNVFNLIGINFLIIASFAVASCFRLSINGLANEAFTGVIRSTQ
jgi:hypothetical protein